MNSFIKDFFKLSNYIKFLKNPGKIKIIFNRLNYYPGVKFAHSKSYIYRYLEISLTIFLAKRNKCFQNIFFKIKKDNKNSIYQDLSEKNSISEKHIDIISSKGVLVLENILDKNELSEIQNYLSSLKDNDYDEIVDMGDSERKFKSFSLDSLKKIEFISNEITEKVYGQVVQPKTAILKTVAKNIPERDSTGDNIYHPDRYLPNIKLFFNPFEVSKKGAPFMFALGSHQITKKYLNFYKKTKQWFFDERNLDSKIFLENKTDIPVKANSLIVACTNGFHGRSKFLDYLDRTVIVLTYSNFNFLSLIRSKKAN